MPDNIKPPARPSNIKPPVLTLAQRDALPWVHSCSSVNNGACVQVAFAGGGVYMRSTLTPDVLLGFSQAEWHSFLEGCRNGEFDSIAGS